MRRGLVAALLGTMALVPFQARAAGEPTVVITSPENTAVVNTTLQVMYRPPRPGQLAGVTYKNLVTMSGTARDDVSVLAVDVVIWSIASANNGQVSVNPSQPHVASCTDCGTRTASWSLVKDLLPGTYVMEARAIDSQGKMGSSDRITFAVAPTSVERT